MIAMLATVIFIQLISLLLLWLNVRTFRNHAGKYQTLFAALGNENVWGTPGKILIPLYIVLAIGASIVTTLVFIFQPHFL